MVAPWNPNSPTLYGIEKPLARSGVVSIAGLSSAVVQMLKAQQTETIARFSLPDPYSGEFDGATTDLAVDIHTARPDLVTGYTVAAYQPNAFTDRVSWLNSDLTTVNMHTYIDEGTAAVNEADYILDASNGAGHTIDFQYGTAAFPASKRILDVRIRARVKGGAMGLQVVHASGNSAKAIIGYSGSAWRTVEVSFGEICPWTGKVWTSTDIALFDTATAEIRLSREDTSTGSFSPRVAALQMGVEYCDENRVAVGHLASNPAGIVSMAAADLFTPAGVANWSKVAGTTYYVVVRRYRRETGVVVDLSSISLHWTAAGDTTVPDLVNDVWPESWSAPTVATKGGRITDLGVATNQRFAFGLLLATNFASVDSQPYARVAASSTAIYKSRQRFVAPASAAYGVLRLLMVSADVIGFEADATTIKVLRASDLVQMGSTLSITRDQMTADGTFLTSSSVGDVWQVQLDFAVDPVLVSGTAYYLEFAGGGPAPIYVDLPENGAFGTGTVPPTDPATKPGDRFSSATFGSDATHLGLAVDSPTYDATFAEHLGGDIVFVLAQSPATLTGAAITIAEQVLDAATPDDLCESVGELPVVQFSWTQSALGADFVRYEVERFDVLEGTWARIANLTSVTATTWFDPDARFGIPESYRVRQVRSGEVASDWTATLSIMLEAPGCGLYFTVAEEQELNLAALDVYGGGPADREFTFLDAKVLVPMIGRDYQVAFQPTETRGVAFSRNLLVNAISAVAPPSIDAMAPLRDLARAPVSAVCVRDHEGNRWYMALTVPSGSIRQPGEFVYVQVSMTQVSAVPTPYTGRGQSLGGS